MTVSTKMAFVKMERKEETGTRNCPGAAFPCLGFSSTLPTLGLGGRVTACQLAVGVEGSLLQEEGSGRNFSDMPLPTVGSWALVGVST